MKRARFGRDAAGVYVSWPRGKKRAWMSRRQMDSLLGELIAAERASVIAELEALGGSRRRHPSSRGGA